jgi:hypothetical protein
MSWLSFGYTCLAEDGVRYRSFAATRVHPQVTIVHKPGEVNLINDSASNQNTNRTPN